MPRATRWTDFTKRTNDPKLAWLECQLLKAGIPSRRSGFSFHAPLLEVPEEHLDAAWAILNPVDDVEDDDPRWTDPGECPPELLRRLRAGGERAEVEHLARLSTRLSGVKGARPLVKRLRKLTRKR